MAPATTETPVAAVETPLPTETKAEEKKEEKATEKKETIKESRPKPSAAKMGRRLSARVGDLFKGKPKSTTDSTPTKATDAAPKLDKPEPVAPLENPAAAETPAPTPAPAAPTAEGETGTKMESTPAVAVSA